MLPQGIGAASDAWAALTAFGTIAAAASAVGIALWSERNRKRDAGTEQLRSARTVLTLCGQAAQYGGIEIVNASDGPIVDVLVVSGECLPWHWVPAEGYGSSHTVLIGAGRTWNAQGHWSPSAQLLAEHDINGNAVPPPNYLTLSLVAVIEWTDSRGTRWQRRSRDEPVKASGHSAAHTPRVENGSPPAFRTISDSRLPYQATPGSQP